MSFLDKLKTAAQVAGAGVEAGAALDKSSALPLQIQVLDLKTL